MKISNPKDILIYHSLKPKIVKRCNRPRRKKRKPTNRYGDYIIDERSRYSYLNYYSNHKFNQ